MELRIPTRLLSEAIANKQVKALRLFLVAKIIHNSRADIRQLFEETDTHPKTRARLIKSIVSNGWAGTDGTYLFPRSWSRLKASKCGGLYLTDTEILSDPKKFEALAFTHALKKLYRRKGPRTTNGGRSAMPDLSLRYVCDALNIKERRCKMLRAAAQNYGFISIERTFWRVGRSGECGNLRIHLQGVNLFPSGKNTLWQTPSRITFKTMDKFCPILRRRKGAAKGCKS